MHTQYSSMILFSSFIRGTFTICSCSVFLNASASSLRFICIYHSLFPVLWNFPSTIISGYVIKVSSGFLFIRLLVTFIIPSFPKLCKHKLVAETLRLEFPVRVIIRLVS